MISAVALLAAVLTQADGEKLDTLIERWRADDPEVRLRAFDAVLSGWKKWTEAERLAALEAADQNWAAGNLREEDLRGLAQLAQETEWSSPERFNRLEVEGDFRFVARWDDSAATTARAAIEWVTGRFFRPEVVLDGAKVRLLERGRALEHWRARLGSK